MDALLASGSGWVSRPATGPGHGLGHRAPAREGTLTSRTRSPDHGWHDVLVFLVVALGVALIHTNCGVLAVADSHDTLAVVSQDPPQPMATASTSPDLEPSAPVNPCHRNGEACCLSALPSA